LPDRNLHFPFRNRRSRIRFIRVTWLAVASAEAATFKFSPNLPYDFPYYDNDKSFSVKKRKQLANVPRLDELIREVRGQKVMLDFDLARVYGVETRALNRAVKRNADRFPKDFMFQSSSREWENLKYQIGTSSSGHGGRRRRPYAFTEHGAIMPHCGNP
jgi:hypothetical protein